ncbi:hypothetical protein NW754_016367 [Fusarium falciforme]|uniref:C2H2-type domain-containing protein n=1 Tax=Fusarium falciforme TaxID=195108 RepID=A0A9W8UZW7_9HYPO|nr:hypothetical protein NW754_016367 [Fusarium falciforme]KAJ4184610.1 hypothetical protein NW755_009063 [Fusarium falciforme]
MPSLRDKATRYSSNRHHRDTFFYHSAQSKLQRLFPGFLRFKPSLDNPTIDRRLGSRRSDMPQASEEKVFVTRNKPSRSSTEHTVSHSHTNQPIGTSRKSRSKKDQESGQDRRGSPASPSGQVNSSPQGRRTNLADECAKLLNVPLPPDAGRRAAASSDAEPTTKPSAAYLDYRINQELCRRKQIIVDSLMAAISECFKRKLEALDEGCDPASGGSHPSSGSVQGIKSTSRSSAAGQKRSSRHGSRDESDNSEDDDSFRKKKDKKRARIEKDDTKPRFACPYHQYDPKTFGAKRTCCGPGWTELPRVKEHLERSHSLPKFQCNRCCRRFKKDEELKKHQRETTPCTVKDPSKMPRDLADGYDEEQARKLKARTRKSPEEKWKEWYGILFNMDPDDPSIPSPYHDASLSTAKASTINRESIPEYREWWTKAKPVIRHRVTKEVEKALMHYEPQVKHDIIESLRDLPRCIADLFPLPGLTSEETSDMAEETGFLDFLDMGDDYIFGDVDGTGFLNDNSATFGSSESSDCSDPYQAGTSSATSVEDDVYQSFDAKTGLAPESFHLSYSANNLY